MTTLLKIGEDGPVRIRGNGSTWERGEVREVSDERADALLEAHDYFEVVDEPGDQTPDTGDEPPDDDLADMTHDELKELAEERGIADEIDLRSKDKIIAALEE